VCPIELSNEFDLGLSKRKAIFKKYDQAIPGAYAITKRGTAPCKATCPAHVSVQGFIALIRQGKYREALALFKENHPFPGVCGRVCHHPCEEICTRNDVDQPLAIQWLHRFLADEDFKNEHPYLPEISEKREEKVAIVGSGPAGLSAAYFLAQEGFQVTVFEKLPVKGGMMAVGIPEYRLPRDILQQEISIIEQLGVNITTGVTFGQDITLESLQAEGYQALYLATGLHESRSLGLEGEDLEGIVPGISFLRQVSLGKEISVAQKTLIIGGGNVAIDCALTAKRLGAEQVTLVCLESREEMPAWRYEIDEALEEGIQIINSLGPHEFVQDQGKVSAITFKRCTQVFDTNGSFNPQYDLNQQQTLSAGTVIVAIGQKADLSWTNACQDLVLSRGLIHSDPVTYQTTIPWVFAGGDACYGPKSVVDAVACGSEAAESISRYLQGKDLKENRDTDWSYEKPDTSDVPLSPRQEIPRLPVRDRNGNFREVALGFNENHAQTEAQRCLECGICSECYQCVQACIAGAIDHGQSSQEFEFPVGSVILCPGNETYDPTGLEEFFHYKTHPNVITSLEFERLLSASGPTMGHLTRPSDGQAPQKIAWLQCVGSRDTNRCSNGYCSAVCCMYAIKEAIIAKEHTGGALDCAIFYMDIRTYGKDYEKYLVRAQEKEGVRFIQSRIHSITPTPDTETLSLKYISEQGQLVEETFDIVVLSVGLQISGSTIDLAKRLGLELNKYNFIQTDPFHPIQTSLPGVYVCGSSQGPKDLPSSVAEASAAACAAGKNLSRARNTATQKPHLPEELDIEAQAPRIGVFVCNCGINISGVVDVKAVEQYCAGLPHVVYTTQNLFTCSEDAQQQMKEAIIDNGLNRVVVASCTPKTHENIFMETLEACGLNKYLFEMANIRNQDSWVHPNTPEEATEKAKSLVHMAVARAATLHPLHEKQIPVIPKALVIGGGVAGMNAALSLADQDFEVFLVEKEPQLGGQARNLTRTIEGLSIADYLEELIEKVTNHQNIQVLTQSLIVGFNGFKGNFTTEIIVGPGMYERKLNHGVILVATGANEYHPHEYLYGQDNRVMTQVELAKHLENQGAAHLKRVVMIQCVGSRNEHNPNCSRICCQSAIKNALRIKELNPETEIFVLYRDIRMYGLLEDYYTQARHQGIVFLRYTLDDPPIVSSQEEGLEVRIRDQILDRPLILSADLVALSTGMVAEDTEELASIIKLARNPEGHFLEAHVKLRPVDMDTEGIFICGTAHSPLLISESISQALAAASRATTYLSQDSLTLSAVTARVNPDKCAACLICVRSCPYGVPRINEEGVSQIDEALCHGCGICAAECPAKAIELSWYEDEQISCKIDALLEGIL
jgi:heterodisulfide reductase subunit A-like polyferredoxin